MLSRPRVTFTESGRQRLESAIEDYRRALEEAIAQEQPAIGDEQIEATASDVERAIARHRMQATRRRHWRDVLHRALFLAGAAILAIGVLLPGLRQLSVDPVQIGLVAGGAVLMFASLLWGAYLYVQVRMRGEDLQREAERIALEREIRRACDTIVSIARLRMIGKEPGTELDPARQPDGR